MTVSLSLQNSGAGCALRPALPADEPFLRHLFTETHATLQLLPSELRPQLAAMQYSGRELTYSANHPTAKNWILLDAEGTPAGRHLVERTPYGYLGVDLAVLPAYQGRGFGTAALLLLQQQTAELGPPAECRLRVTRNNPALRLYLRLGFQPMAEDELSYEMVWSAPPARTP